MAALIEFSTNRPVWVSMDLSDGTRSRRVAYGRQPSRNFTIPILGLSPGKRHRVHLTVADVYGNSVTWTEVVEVETAPLPDDFPLLRVKISVPDEMEPGVTLFSAVPYEGGAFSFLIAVDEEGEVVWYYRADHVIGYVTQLRNGNLLYLYRAGAIEYRAGAIEIDWLGNMLRHWIPASLASSVAAGDIPVSADSLHHDMQELPNGNLLGLSTELRRVDQYPSSEADPSAPAETAHVVGDVVVEFTPDGRIVDSWSLLDLLDLRRICYGSLDGFWDALYRDFATSTKDWTHANALFHDPSDDSILVSLRHQDALIKVSRATGELRWILGTPGGWNPPWHPYLLQPDGEVEWPYHQHSSTVTPEGTILLFDNGNFRARRRLTKPWRRPNATVGSSNTGSTKPEGASHRSGPMARPATRPFTPRSAAASIGCHRPETCS